MFKWKGIYEVKKVYSFALISVLFLTTVTVNVGQASAESIDGLKNKINELEKEQEELNKKQGNIDNDKSEVDGDIDKNLGKQSDVSSEIDDIDEKLSNTESDIDNKENEITETNQKIEDLKNRIEALKEEIIVLKERIEKREALLKNRLRAIQQTGGDMKYIEVILGSKSFGDFISRSGAVNTIMNQDKTIMEEQTADKLALEDNKKEVESSKVEVEERKVALEDQKKELVALKGQLDEQKDQRKTLMAQLEEEHEDLEDHKLSLEEEKQILAAQTDANKKAVQLAEQEKGNLEQLAKEKAAKEKAAEEKAAKEQAEKEQQQAQAKEKSASSNNSSSKSESSSSKTASTASAPASTPSSSGGGGKFIWPANGPKTSDYGWRSHPISGGKKLHAGMDIGVGIGTPLQAAASGVVISAGAMNGYGNTIMISHSIDGQSYTTLYAHLDSVSVSAGQHVSQGQTIGATGNTGGSTGPHLHFEIHEGGWNAAKSNSVDPLKYLR